MSQLVQRNDFYGEIHNFGGGTIIAGAVIHTGGGDFYIGGHPVNGAGGSGLDLLEAEGLCVLSLDGGGMDGLSALYVLGELFAQLNARREQSGRPAVKPCDVFDLIGGAGVGGLIAIMLGQLQLDVDDSIAMYTSLWDATQHQLQCKLRDDVRADSANLEDALTEAVKALEKSATDAFTITADHHGCRVVLCVVENDPPQVTRLRNYSAPSHSSPPPSICEAVMATLVGTSFDSAASETPGRASSVLNAKAMATETADAASEIWCSETSGLKSIVKCFVAIGATTDGAEVHQLGCPPNVSPERHFPVNLHEVFRNRLAEQGLQDEAAMKEATKEVMGNLTGRAQRCIRSLGGKQKKTDIAFERRLQDFNLVGGVRSESARDGQACWTVPSDPNPRFVGRSAVLADLEAALFTTGAFAKVALVGLGGIGKTQIALELAHRTRARWPDCAVFWVPAVSADTVRQAYVEIGTQLRVAGLEERNADVFALVRRRLSDARAGRWLFILDNADNFDMWFGPRDGAGGARTRLADYLPASARGSVLITTRSRKVAVRMTVHKLVEVTAMDGDAAAELLRKWLVGRELSADDDAMVQPLLQELTFLPLAIVQAASYINERTVSLREYMELLNEAEQTKVELLSEEFEVEERHDDPKKLVARTWLVSFEQIRRQHPLAADYLSFMSCLEPRMIPQSVLPDAPSRKKMLEAIGTLKAYSFISTASDDQLYDIHRLVHLATRDWLEGEGLTAGWAGKAFARLFDAFRRADDINRKVWRVYLPHALRILAFEGPEVDAEEKTTLQAICGWCLRSDGRYAEAERLNKQVMETQIRLLGQEHPSTLVSMGHLALTYSDMARWKEAEGLAVQVMKAGKRTFGPEHPNTLTIMGNLSTVYRHQGRLREAESLGVEVMETRRKTLGPEHADTLASMGNLALIYKDLGLLKEAGDLEDKVMKLRKNALGSEHPLTLVAMGNLALTYHDLGRLKEAEKLTVQVVETRTETFGAEHLSTLTSKGNLAAIYRDQGRLKDAEKLEVLVMTTRKKALGEEHPETLKSMGNLAMTYREQGLWTKAEVLEKAVVETNERVLGHEHPDTLASKSNIATTYEHQGRWTEAEASSRQVMDTMKSVLGEEHPRMLTCAANYALVLGNMGRLEEASELCRKVIERQKRLFGEENIQTLTSMGNLASTRRKQGRLKEAEKLDVSVLTARKKVLGEEHPDTLRSMGNLAATYLDQARLKEAEELGEQVIETRKRVSGPDHPDTLRSISNFATVLWKQGRKKEAEELSRQVLAGDTRVFGPEHPSTLTSMANLAVMLHGQGRWDEAGALAERVMETTKRVLGPEHPSTLTSMGTLAATYKGQGRLADAERLEVQVLEGMRKTVGDDHVDTAIAMANLAMTLWTLERWSEAEKLEEQVVKIRKKALGPEHPSTLTSIANLAITWQALGRKVRALLLMTDCYKTRRKCFGDAHPETILVLEYLKHWGYQM